MTDDLAGWCAAGFPTSGWLDGGSQRHAHANDLAERYTRGREGRIQAGFGMAASSLPPVGLPGFDAARPPGSTYAPVRLRPRRPQPLLRAVAFPRGRGPRRAACRVMGLPAWEGRPRQGRGFLGGCTPDASHPDGTRVAEAPGRRHRCLAASRRSLTSPRFGGLM